MVVCCRVVGSECSSTCMGSFEGDGHYLHSREGTQLYPLTENWIKDLLSMAPPCYLLGAKLWWGFPGGSEVKASTSNAGDLGLIPGLGRSPGEGNGNPLQYSGQETPMDCIVHRVTKSQYD